MSEGTMTNRRPVDERDLIACAGVGMVIIALATVVATMRGCFPVKRVDVRASGHADRYILDFTPVPVKEGSTK